jgi:ribonucleotide reductase beta subunit family protein with ferritin-like domain
MVVLTAVSQFIVSARMAAVRVQLGSIQATVAGNPLLEQFGKLHLVSVILESAVLLAGFAAMYFMVRESVAH